jgi:hypothetical protein
MTMEEIKNISGKNPFKVPDNYFEEVNRKIISGTSGKVSEKENIGIYRKLRPYLAVAAAVTLLAALSYSGFYFFSGKADTEVPGITLNEFSENYLNEIDLLTLEEKAGSIENIGALMSLNSNEILNYFELENIDINDIYTQY